MRTVVLLSLILALTACEVDQFNAEKAGSEYCKCMDENESPGQYVRAASICEEILIKRYRYYKVFYVDMGDPVLDDKVDNVTRDSTQRFMENFYDYLHQNCCEIGLACAPDSIHLTFQNEPARCKIVGYDSSLKKEVYEYTDEESFYRGGKDAFIKYLRSSFSPKNKDRIQDTLNVKFVVDTDGKLKNIHFPDKSTNDLTGDDLNFLRVLKNMPPWQPAKCSGQAVAWQSGLTYRYKVIRGD